MCNHTHTNNLTARLWGLAGYVDWWVDVRRQVCNEDLLKTTDSRQRQDRTEQALTVKWNLTSNCDVSWLLPLLAAFIILPQKRYQGQLVHREDAAAESRNITGIPHMTLPRAAPDDAIWGRPTANAPP